jgi:ATP/maltotriose-dependent transcriptional regulator MalT
VTTRVTTSRLVGRGAELARLEAALADAAAGRPALAFVAGDSGVGKSRLIAELEERARAEGACVLHGESVELGEGELPFGPLVGALRPLARSRDDVLDELDEGSRAELARLLPAFGRPGALAGTEPAPERTAQARLFEAVLELLDRLGAGGTVLLVLEDIHWADPSTRAFVAFLGRSLGEEHVLVVASYRLDELHRRHPLRPLLAEIERDPSVARIELPPLTRDEVALALDDILGERPPRDLVDRLYARTEGNALFLEEVLAAGPDGRGALPATLRDALMVRVDRLSEDAQALLRVLAIAQIADHALLARASGLEPAALGAALREAVATHVIVAGDDGQHAFRHALLREVVQDDLLPGEREQLHLALARALEDRAGGAQVAAGVAFHYAAAGAQPAALAASVRAAAAAERIHAYDEAAALVERALELWDRVDDPEALAGAGRLELLSRAAEHHAQGSDQARAEPLLRAALDAVDRGREPRPAAALLERLARVQWRQGRSDEALATAREGLELVAGDASSPERARLLGWFAKTRMLQGRYRDAVRAGREALTAATAAGDAAALSGALNAVGVSLIHQGEIDEGVAHLHDAMARARDEGRPGDRRTAAVNLADALHLAGRLGDARDVAREAAEEARRDGHVTLWLAVTVSELAFEAGEWDEADRWMPSADRRFTGLELAIVELRRAEAALGRGEHAGVAERLERIAPLIADSGEAQFHGTFGAVLAELRRRAGDLDGARDAVFQALDRIEFCTDDALRLARVSAAGIAVEADRAQRGRDLGDAEETARALAGVDDLLLRVEAAAADGGALPGAWLIDARADAARAAGADDPNLWAAAAETWDALGRPYPALVARRRQAEALVVRDDRDAAGPIAAAALGRARDMGAGWLAGELEALMARARLRHDGAAPPSLAADGDAADEPFGLTPRERQVLALVARGATNREIGAELFMAEKTASVHVSRILAKLDVRTRTEAAAVAHRLGLAG